MPQVPAYSSPQVQPDALPGAYDRANASAASFGGVQASQAQAMGAGFNKFGHAINEIATDIQERENAALVFGAETALKDAYNQYETQAKQRKGANAWGLAQETDKWFEKQAEEHSKTLTNDAQRTIFGQQLSRLRSYGMRSMSDYEVEQRNVTLAESAQSSIVSSINLAAGAASDGEVINEKGEVSPVLKGVKGDILKRIDVLAQLNGWTPEKRELEVNRNVTMMHKQVLTALVDHDASGAKKYYEANKAEIDGAERASIEKTLKIGGLRQEAQEAVDKIFAAGVPEKEVPAYVRKNYEGELEDEILARTNARFAEGDRMREQGQRRAADVAWKAFSQRQKLEDIPSSVVAAMDGRDIETLRAHAANTASGVSVKTDPETYYGLRAMAAQDPAAFRSLDLRRYATKLASSDFQEFVKLQTGSEADLKDAATLTAQLSNTHDLLGLKGSDVEKKGKLDKVVTDAVQAEQQRLGKKLNYDERQKIIDRVLMKGEIPGFWNDREGRAYEFAGDPEAAQFKPEIEEADRTQIVDAFKKKYNREPTDDEVMHAFKVWKGL